MPFISSFSTARRRASALSLSFAAVFAATTTSSSKSNQNNIFKINNKSLCAADVSGGNSDLQLLDNTPSLVQKADEAIDGGKKQTKIRAPVLFEQLVEVRHSTVNFI